MTFPTGAIIIDLSASGMRGPPADQAALNAAVAAAAGSAATANADAVATAADRVATGQDRAATGADRTAAHDDRIATDFDAIATAGDRVQTGLDSAATAADRTATHTDKLAADADAAATSADRLQTGIDSAAARADRLAADADVVSTAASALAAANSTSAAQLAAATAGVYINAAAANVPRGITATSLTAGSGGTNNTNIAATFSGGNFTGNPTILFDIVGGAVTNVRIISPGLYIGAAPSVPTVTLPGAAGGAALTLTAGFLVSNGAGYWVQSADLLTIGRYSNVSGVATVDPNGVSIYTAVGAAQLPPIGMSLEHAAARNYNDSGNAWPWFADKLDGVLLGVDQSTGDLYGLSADRLQLATPGDQGPSLASLGVSILPSLAASSGWNGLVLYGQSNSGGSDSAVLTTTTAYTGMLTFGSGPKSSKAGNSQGAINTSPGTSTTIALVEDTGQSDGFSPSGETMCSGATRRFLEMAAIYSGVDPNSLTIIASSAGHGSQRITSLNKGANPISPGTVNWYQQLLDHVSEGKARATAAGKTYAVQVVPFIQGEADAQGGNTASGAYANYLAYLLQLRIDIDADIRAITGQAQPVHLLLSINPYAVTTNAEVTMAQVDACELNPYIHIAGSRYHLSHSPGNVHMNATSKIRHAADFGRAWYQIDYGQRKPDQIRFVAATAIGTTLTLTLKVPQLPLVFDTTNLPAGTQDYGFKVVDDTGTLTLSNFVIRGRTITVTLHRALGANPKLRYALDYAPTTILVTGNAAGNLRDSTQDTYIANGTTYQHFYVAPPKQINILKLAS